ncbi:HD domain-containing protein [Candidatus Pacearchaeota archaeon]|nr:HD domain-containing protein [Candidatus Pacearchaeota archaeon]
MGEKQFLNLAENKQLIGAIQRKEQKLGDVLTKEEIEYNLKRICKLVLAAVKSIEIKKGHDPYKHGLDLIKKAREIAKKLNCPTDKIELIGCAAYLHDIGKSMIDRGLVNKPSQLTFSEYREIQKHTVIGQKILKPFVYLGTLVRHHHERVDGRGYPDGLKGNKIPLGSRIISLLDVYNAITHSRAYSPSRPKEFAINEIKRCAGLPFDIAYLKTFRRVYLYELSRNLTQEGYKNKILDILCKKWEFDFKRENRKSIKEIEEDYLHTRLRQERQFDRKVARVFLRLLR